MQSRLQELRMKLYVYADESGVFDKAHDDIFVYGGVIVLASRKEDSIRQYLALERDIRVHSNGKLDGVELKASFLSMKDRSRVFRLIPRYGCWQFATIVDQTRALDSIYVDKKTKQRFLDYALKRAIKHGVCSLFANRVLTKSDVSAINVVVDEHSTSTNGRYNLEESINNEFRFGTYNMTWDQHFPPVFGPDFPPIPVSYVDSAKVPLVRAADVTANWVYRAERDRDTYPAAFESVRNRVSLLMLP